MHLGAAFVADEQPLELVEVGEGALDDPAERAEPGAVFALRRAITGLMPRCAEQPAVLVVVVAAVGDAAASGRLRGRPTRPATGGHPVEQRDQLGDVVAVAAGQRPGERDPGRVDEEMVLRAASGLYLPGSGPFRSPLFRLDVAAVDDRPRPLDLAGRTQPRQQQRVQPLPHPGLLPLVQPAPARVPRPVSELLRQIGFLTDLQQFYVFARRSGGMTTVCTRTFGGSCPQSPFSH